MGSLIKGFTKSPLKQWVLYQGVDVCAGIVVSRKLKIIKIKLSKKLLDAKEYASVEGPTNCNAATSTTRQCNNNENNNNNIKERLAGSG